MAIVIGIGLFALLIFLFVAWIMAGNLIKAVVLWTPPLTCLGVGLSSMAFFSWIGSSVCIFISLVGAYQIYESWEFSDKFTEIERRVNQIFGSE